MAEAWHSVAERGAAGVAGGLSSALGKREGRKEREREREEKEKREKKKKGEKKRKKGKINGEKEKRKWEKGKREKGASARRRRSRPRSATRGVGHSCAVVRDARDEGEQRDVTAGFRCQDRVLRKIGRSGGKMVRAQRPKTFETNFSA